MDTIETFVSTVPGVRLFARIVRANGRRPTTTMLLVPNGMHLVEDFAHLAHERTIVFYDVRNRGRSDAVDDPAMLAGGVHNDVDDLDAVRRHFGAGRVDIIGHSYLGLTAILYALKYPESLNRIVQVGPIPPDQATTYPADLSHADATLGEVRAAIAALQQERESHDPVVFCRKFWEALRPLYVADPADAQKIRWDRCDLPNERAFMRYWTAHLMPSMQRLELSPERLAAVAASVLTIHGRKDRSSPYGAGLDWARRLANARLLTVDSAGHAPWIEEPGLVFGAIETFLDGSWPAAAVEVSAAR